MTFRDRMLDDDIYCESGSISLEQMNRFMRAHNEAMLDLIKFSINPPGWSTKDVEELKEGAD